MSKTFDQSREEIAKLCRYFSSNRNEFLKPGIKEAHIRLHLIDPFFECLGWDVRNTALIAPQYREVVTEDSLEIEGTQKAPDYSFRVGTLSKYFGEAKKCGININADPLPAYQLRRYGWSAKVPLSILTDFEEFGVYDCSARPKPADKASFGRLNYLRFDEYPDRWRELWDIFSRQAVWEGAFDKYAASRRKRGTSEVDSEFLKEIEGWREALARNIALRNLFLSPDDLNSVVQRTIDRVIFLRMAEDRGSEPYGQLLKLCEQPDIYKRFIGKLCRSADEKYNSGLFHFQKEERIADAPDFISIKLQVDDKVFKPILQSLYFEHGSPYHFGVLPVELLGTVYERFLGKVIRLTPDHRAKVEEKPEVRKAGGVYYTPAYIVDYIVKNTVGKLIEGKSPAQLAKFREMQPLRVLDMACGSGSFLLGAFKCLLDYSLKWYAENNPEKFKKEVYKTSKGEWRLSIAEKKRLLTTHIFGVDIDPQAVEVSKLSLLLKVMEGETDETVGQSRMLFQERALPNLANNIKCGNSLIASDFSMLPEDLVRVNAFDWPAQFPYAMKAGGFDAIIGNPPWGSEIQKDLLEHIRQKYVTAQGELDSYMLFIEKGLSLLRKDSLYGVILPDTWLTLKNSSRLRRWLLGNFSLLEVVALNESVFVGATVDPLVLIIRNNIPNEKHLVSVRTSPKKMKLQDLYILDRGHECNQSDWLNDGSSQIKIHITSDVDLIVGRMRDAGVALETLMDYRAGCKPYEVGKGTPPQTQSIVDQKPYTSHTQIAFDWKMLIRGNDVQRYFSTVKKAEWIKYGKWLAAPRDPRIFKGSRILIQAIRNPSLKNRIVANFTEDEMIARINVYTLLKRDNVDVNYSYILGVLNSSLMNWFLTKDYGLHTYVITGVLQLPIRHLNLSNSSERASHDKMVALVDKMLALTPKLHGATAESEKAALQNAVSTTDTEIDRLVYELYGLTKEEISIVDSESKK